MYLIKSPPQIGTHQAVDRKGPKAPSFEQAPTPYPPPSKKKKKKKEKKKKIEVHERIIDYHKYFFTGLKISKSMSMVHYIFTYRYYLLFCCKIN